MSETKETLWQEDISDGMDDLLSNPFGDKELIINDTPYKQKLKNQPD